MLSKKYKFVFLFLVTYASYAFCASQLIPYLQSLGFDVFERGIIISCTSIAAIVFQLIVGYLSDKWKTVKKIAIFCLTMYGIVSYLVYAYPVAQFVFCLVAVSLMMGLFNTNFATIDNWVLESEKSIFEQYSFIRMFGSLGWAVASLICGQLLSAFGFSKLGLGVLILSIIALYISWFISDAEKSHTSIEVKKGDYRKLVTYKPYLLLVIILFLLNAVQTLNIYSVIDKIMLVDGSSLHIGAKNAIQGFIEIPTFLFGFYIMRRLNSYNLLKISAVVYGVQFLLFGLAQTADQMIMITVMQLLTYPLLLIAQKNLLFQLSLDSLKSSGQLLANSIAASGSALVIPFIAGVITKNINIDMTMFFGTAMSFVGFILALQLHRMPK